MHLTLAADPLDVARDMIERNLDPGLVAHYIAIELDRDPTIGMTPIQRAMHQIKTAFATWRRPKPSDFMLLS